MTLRARSNDVFFLFCAVFYDPWSRVSEHLLQYHLVLDMGYHGDCWERCLLQPSLWQLYPYWVQPSVRPSVCLILVCYCMVLVFRVFTCINLFAYISLTIHFLFIVFLSRLLRPLHYQMCLAVWRTHYDKDSLRQVSTKHEITYRGQLLYQRSPNWKLKRFSFSLNAGVV